LDEVIIALEETKNTSMPLMIDVHEDENGEKVQIYIG
jgi:hypothetical protein